MPPNAGDNQDVMSVSDQSQKLVDKIHSMNNTISIFKKIDKLKRKRKKAIETSKPNKAAKYSLEVAKKEGTVQSFCLALSRHAEELKRLSSQDGTSSNKETESANIFNGADDNCDESSVKLEGDE